MKKTPVTMPLLSDTMQTGRLARWLKQPGDAIKTGDVLAEVESDKAIMDVEAFADGYLVGPLAKADTDIPVKTTIAWISDTPPNTSAAESQDADPAAASTSQPLQTPAPKKPEPTQASEPPAASHPAATSALDESSSQAASQAIAQTSEADSRTVQAAAPSPVVAATLAGREGDSGISPFARGLAAELGVDLDQIAPRDGSVNAAQVLAAALGPQTPHLEFGPTHRIERPSPMKAAMAENMAHSVRTPTFHVTIAVDLKPLHDQAHAEHKSFSLLLARACALSVHEHPDFNACWTPAGLARRERIDIAIAVDTPDGLITPVLRDSLRPLDELAEDWRQLKDKLEHRRLEPADYSGATFYLSNLGPFPGVEQFDAIVPSGAAAILAVAAPSPDGLTRLTLSCDHRVVAGADAARFLATLGKYLGAVDALHQ
jgi:pyruvate dehydrogenase E2 component (dihydrolipoamide acetyltransferase)